MMPRNEQAAALKQRMSNTITRNSEGRSRRAEKLTGPKNLPTTTIMPVNSCKAHINNLLRSQTRTHDCNDGRHTAGSKEMALKPIKDPDGDFR